jgi:probable rRNA maturation factor
MMPAERAPIQGNGPAWPAWHAPVVHDSQRVIYRPPWRIELTRRVGPARILADTTLAIAIEAALVAAGAPRPAAIGLILTGDQEIAELNESQMGHVGPTDVLSFPLLLPSSFPDHAGKTRTRENRDPASGGFGRPGGRVHLGEIVVSIDRAVEQAEQGRGGHTGNVSWSPTDELRLLVTHGVLHICGWDHAQPIEEKAMRALESSLLGMTQTP